MKPRAEPEPARLESAAWALGRAVQGPPRITRGTRLRHGALWWLHAWPFRFAHRPLCARFAPDVLRVGPLHLCRGCTAFAAGLVGTLGLLFWFHVPATSTAIALLTSGLALLAVLSTPRRHIRWPRALRDGLRAAAGAWLALALGLAMAGALLPGALFLGLGLVLSRVHTHQRAPLRARGCDGCPELSAPGVCSGYRQQAAATRRYEERIECELLAGLD